MAKKSIKMPVLKAINPSEHISKNLRFIRSESTPANGPIITVGRNDIIVAVARVVAFPVSMVSHQIRANLTSALPKSENACPVQRRKNRERHFKTSWSAAMCAYFLTFIIIHSRRCRSKKQQPGPYRLLPTHVGSVCSRVMTILKRSGERFRCICDGHRRSVAEKACQK